MAANLLPLRIKHPNLFRMNLSIVLVNFAISIALLTQDPQRLINFQKLPEQGIIPPLSFWGTLWFIAGLMILYGIIRTNEYKWTRRGLTMSAAIGGFWAFGFVIQYFTGGILGVSAPILWTFYTLSCMTASNEPTVNPLSAVLQNDIHTTLQDSRHRDHVLHKDHPQPNIPTLEDKQIKEKKVKAKKNGSST